MNYSCYAQNLPKMTLQKLCIYKALKCSNTNSRTGFTLFLFITNPVKLRGYADKEYGFYDLDDEVKSFLGISIEEFVNTGTLFYRDQIRCSLINRLIQTNGNKVLAVTPLSHIENILHLFSSEGSLSIHLYDSPRNIFDRLVFSDENDCTFKDEDYKNQHRAYYISEIKKDISWYDKVYSVIKNKFDMAGNSPEIVTEQLIKKYQLNR